MTPSEFLRQQAQRQRDTLQQRITEQVCREKDKPLPPTTLRTKREST